MDIRSKRTWAALLLAAVAAAGCDSTDETTKPTPGAVDSLVVVPDSGAVSIGAVIQFTAVAYDSAGQVTSATIDWDSSDESVFTIDAQGRVFGESEGVAWVIASVGTVVDSAVVRVTAATRGWFTQPSGTTGTHLNGVYFLANGRDGWVVGDAGRVLRTYDAGSSWAQQSATTSANLHAVWFTNANEGWAVGNSGTVLRTTNGGLNWSRVLNTFAAENLLDVHFANRDSGWIVGENGVILRTTNAGTSWQRTVLGSDHLYSVSFFGSLDGWAVGRSGAIIGTHDGGASWFSVQGTVTASDLRAVWRVSESRANAVGIGGATPRTVAGPDTTLWEAVEVGAPHVLDGVYFTSGTTGWAVGFGGGGGLILRSDDGGASWLSQSPPSTSSALNDVFFVNAQSGWAVGDNGTIFHTVTGGLP